MLLVLDHVHAGEIIAAWKVGFPSSRWIFLEEASSSYTCSMAGLQIMDLLFSRLSVRSCVASSSRMLSASLTSMANKHGYATHANSLGGLKPSKGATKNVGCRLPPTSQCCVTSECPSARIRQKESLVDLDLVEVEQVEEVRRAKNLALAVVPELDLKVVRLR